MSFPKKSLENKTILFLFSLKERSGNKQGIWIWRSDRWETGTGPPIRTTFMCPTVRVFLCHCQSREENGLKFCFFFPNYIILFSLFPKNICHFVYKTGESGPKKILVLNICHLIWELNQWWWYFRFIGFYVHCFWSPCTC